MPENNQTKIFMEDLLIVVEDLKGIAVDAGEAIMEVYGTSFEDSIQSKSDDSPLTKADLAANAIILNRLNNLAVKYPVISEETEIPDFNIRRNFGRYWLVDPLDGTREFINRNDEFTVNIALVEEGRAIFGCVYVPVTKSLYWALKGHGANIEQEGLVQRIKTKEFRFRQKGLRFVGSRSFSNEETEKYISQFEDPVIKQRGSSLKMMLIAEGKADIYPRLGTTMEWDTAAAQAILEEAGGRIVKFDNNNKSLEYNKKDLRNPGFIAFGNCMDL